MRSILTQPILARPMRFTLAIALLLGVVSAISVAQDSIGKVHKLQAGKGTKADLSRYKDKSDLVLRQNNKSGPASELNKIEQQSMHAGPSVGSRPARLKTALLPKTNAAKPDKNPSINFSTRSAGGNRALTTTNQKSGGKSPAGKSPMSMGGHIH
jgi:hypothetical protein